MKHKQFMVPSLCSLVLGLWAVASLGAVPYDVVLQKFIAKNAPGGKYVGNSLTLEVTVVDNGPGPVNSSDGLKVIVSRFDQTGQQFQKEVGRRDLFLLQPQSNTDPNALKIMTVTFDDSNPPTGSYFYRAAIGGSGYYSDTNNTNNKGEVFIQVSLPLTWTSRLWPQDFARAGVTLSGSQATALNNHTYSLQSIVSGSTDRFVDGNKCTSCHSGADNQYAAKYQPVYDGSVIKVDRDHKLDKGGAVTTGYRWNAGGSAGVVGRFVNSTAGNKPVELEKIFQLWLSDGGRQ